MDVETESMENALRWSWCHMTEEPDWARIVEVLLER
jgi:NADPH-dependent 7-cyano-7-deazaguanine reductase QueF